MDDGCATLLSQHHSHFVGLACLEEGGSLLLRLVGGLGVNLGLLALEESDIAVEGGGGSVSHMGRV